MITARQRVHQLEPANSQKKQEGVTDEPRLQTRYERGYVLTPVRTGQRHMGAWNVRPQIYSSEKKVQMRMEIGSRHQGGFAKDRRGERVRGTDPGLDAGVERKTGR